MAHTEPAFLLVKIIYGIYYFPRINPKQKVNTMQCNIARRGKVARLITGLLCVLAGGVLITLAFMEAGSFWLLAGIGLVCLAGGLFQIFEAWAGWCPMRAMGFKTPM